MASAGPAGKVLSTWERASRACDTAGMNNDVASPSCAGYRFPAAIIVHAVWRYFRFARSYRDVEELLAERGVIVSYETVRRWTHTLVLSTLRQGYATQAVCGRAGARSGGRSGGSGQAGDGAPGGAAFGPQVAGVVGGEAVAARAGVAGDWAIRGEEALGMARRLEAPHPPFRSRVG